MSGWSTRLIVLAGLLACCFQQAFAQRGYKPPADIEHRQATIMSEGSRLAAECFVLSERAGERLPTLILSHGWGGNAALLRPEAVFFARGGFYVVIFDYRGWGASEGRVVLTSPAAADRKTDTYTAEVRELREMVDPLDQINDLLNVLHWVSGEPQCDPDRIGLWGTSYSGGHVVFAAASDPRVKATVSQVPSLDSRWVINMPAEREKTLDEARRRARGELPYPAPGARVIGNLRGAPIREKLARYAPVDLVEQAPQCAMMFIIAENEELFDNREHAILAHERAQGPKKLITIPGITHYGVYLQARDECQKLSLAWFQEQLQGK
jgi:dienelactone hydrolase